MAGRVARRGGVISTVFRGGTVNKRLQLDIPDVDGRIILKRILRAELERERERERIVPSVGLL